jgi:RHS repeat-associated protein
LNFELPEPYAVKVSCTVLAGESGSNAADLLGFLNDCPFRYQGQYEDSETGLYYNRFRYYSPEEGVYLSQDSTRLRGGVKLYGYVHNTNSYIDIFGLDPLSVLLADYPELLEETRQAYKEPPEWWGIDPDKTDVFYRSKEEVDIIRAKPGESGGGIILMVLL